jgi:hypothetical protein
MYDQAEIIILYYKDISINSKNEKQNKKKIINKLFLICNYKTCTIYPEIWHCE